MKLLILFFVLIISCSSVVQEEFLTNLAGSYIYSDSSELNIRFVIPNSPQFIFNGITYTLHESVSSVSAIYKMDDVRYVGLFIDTTSI